jgi:hypothetical protein
MSIVVGPGIEVGPGIVISTPLNVPDTGTLVAWSSLTVFDSWTSRSGVTTSDIPTVNTAGSSSTGNTSALVWQLYYAWQAISIPVINPFARVASTVNGINALNLRYSISSTDYTIGNFSADVSIGSISATSYTAGGTLDGPVTTGNGKSIPANRYFLLGTTAGPFYRSFKTLAANRTATVGGNPVFTAINRFWWQPTGGAQSGLPSQVGGAVGTFTEYNGLMPVTAFLFQT